MAASSSKVNICNRALDYLGATPISNIDSPSTPTESLFARHYDDCRQETLRKVCWHFAKQRTMITRSGTPIFNGQQIDYQDAYTLPQDMIRFLSVNSPLFSGSPAGNINDINAERWQSEDYDIGDFNGVKTIFINAGGSASIACRYIQDIIDINQWDALARKILTLTLALETAYPITKSKEKVEEINKLLTLEIAEAQSINGQERPPLRIQKSNRLAGRQIAMLGSIVAPPWTYIP